MPRGAIPHGLSSSPAARKGLFQRTRMITPLFPTLRSGPTAGSGASTGRFIDCLLQRGAARVHAIDVGTNQLAWKIRSDERVVSREKFIARNLTEQDIGERVGLAVTDLSFISLTKVLSAVFGLLEEGGGGGMFDQAAV